MTFLFIGVILLCNIIIYFFHSKNLLFGFRDNDGLFHLESAKEIKIKKSLLIYHNKYFPGHYVRYTYPPLFHVFLSILIGQVSEKKLLLLPVISSIIISLFLFLISIFLGYSYDKAMLVSCIYLIMPSNIANNFAITPRQLGIIFYTLSSFFGAFSIQNNSLLYLFISIIFLGLLFLTHRMGSQLIIICWFIINFILLSLKPVFIFYSLIWLISGLLFAIIITHGKYIYVFLDHLKRLKIHFNYGSQTGKGFKLPNMLEIISLNPYIIIIIMSYFSSSFNKLPLYTILRTLILIIGAVSILWLWGSGSRHIIFSSPLVALLIPITINITSYSFIILTVLSIIIMFYYVIIQYRKNLIPQTTYDVYNYLNEKSDSTVVAILPKIASPSFVYFVNKKIFSFPHDSGAMIFNRILLRDNLNNSGHIANIFIKGGVDALLINKKYNAANIVSIMNFIKSYENIDWIVFEKHIY